LEREEVELAIGAVNIPATVFAVSNATERAEYILKEIDRRWPVKKRVNEPNAKTRAQ
jgi:hypothetical protein